MTAVSDNFTNVDGTDITAHTAGGVNWVKFKSGGVATIQGNKVLFGEDGGNQAGGIMSGRVFTTHDQWAEVDYDIPTGITGPLVRGSVVGDPEANGGSGDAYVFRLFSSGWQICRLSGTGSLALLLRNTDVAEPAPPSTGTARLEANGTTLTASINGTVVGTVTDSIVTEGRRAGVNWSTGTGEADNFSAADANVTTADAYEYDGPPIGQVNVESSNFSLTPSGGDWPSGQSIAVTSDGAGTFSPAGPYTPSGSDTVNFTYTPTSKVGSPHTITPAATPALGTDPTPIDYAVVDYSTVNTTSPNGEAITVLVPSSYDPEVGAHVVLYCHGNNGTNEEMGSRTVAEQAAFIDALIDAGYLLAASNMSGNNWGNADATADLVDLYAYCVTNYRLLDTLIWSASMGGLPGLLAIADERIPRVVGWAGIVPVCNLADMYDSGNGQFADLIETGHNVQPDGSDYATQTAGRDPVLLAASSFTDVGFMFIASSGDTIVDKTQNADLMHTLVNPVAFESSVISHTGDHGDSTRYGEAVPEVIDFFARCVANAPGNDAAGTYPAEGDVRLAIPFGPSDSLTGTLVVTGGGSGTYPDPAFVLDTSPQFGPDGALISGTYHAPDASEVLDSAVFGPSSGTSGTYHAPEAAEVISTAVFGVSSGTSGTVVQASTSDVRSGTTYGPGSSLTGTLVVTGGSGTDHTEQLNRIEAQTSQIIGTSLKWCGPVKDGGFVILHKGIDYVPAISTQILIPIDDIGGSIHAQLTAASTTLMTFEASRDQDSSEILGTVVSSSHSDDVTTVAVQIESTATSDATPAADYAYHVKFGDAEGRTGLAFVGDLELKEERV